MDILQIVLLGVVAAILYILLKEVNKSLAFFLILITGIIIFFSVIQQIQIIFETIRSLGNQANIQTLYLNTILKIIGISYIAEIGSHLTKDAGLDSVSKYIELAGKIFILLLAVPIITTVIEAIVGFLPNV
ncbi:MULTISPECIES: stage III sporulation protein AD [Oceanobacillus]|uniref:Stage III sporulation protein AD n=1 Tax=Oceanobacillus kimchii TaxID=746691 RepID=A0ABQ5TJA3_9BACI|nr:MULTISPECIES: stage III sporulation protein AD [Oceanobacillus]MBT2598357.1 stage III sporulation protein AD [Oceanobacillus sp. ISL-74]MBT2651275.1 stage III sporulation protein AD [Oceanobacillus sp. ISL-73]MCT1575934.1 stage III sporulation protein AD [Oceanobacillus kimchii]MCT2135571.1 stage III sporulation protein AD [Oceanobacillus kimchii]OEH55674.1 stage III sporulation protein AD [Oceanobacillus sp. E9]